jgi:hypothetical protein
LLQISRLACNLAAPKVNPGFWVKPLKEQHESPNFLGFLTDYLMKSTIELRHGFSENIFSAGCPP